MGRILRIGVDTVTNYTLLATSAYDAGNPAATTSPWPNSAAMDQPFTQASPTEVSAQGALVTFSRFPDSYSGAQVKLHPTYDVSTSENPFFEMWVHDSVALTWTLRASIQLSNPFVGIASGARKVLDFTFFPFLRHIDMVWLTLNPGVIGAPTVQFDAIQLFGQCEGALRSGSGPGGIQYTCDPSKADPTAIPPIVYTGFKVIYSSTPPFITHVPCDDFAGDPGCAFPDLCNPASIAVYRECLRGIGDGGTSLNNFDGWFTLNNALITSNCNGNTNTALPDPPPVKAPKLPPVDFCDPTSIDAHRAAIAGDADLLASFNALIDALTEAGYFTLVCPPDDPPATYVDPVTLQPAADPVDQPVRPFHAGPGGDPAPNPPKQDSVPPKHINAPNQFVTEKIFFIFGGAAAQANFEASLPGNYSAEIQRMYAMREPNTFEALRTLAIANPPSEPYQQTFTVTHLPGGVGADVSLRVFDLGIQGITHNGFQTVRIADNVNGPVLTNEAEVFATSFGTQAPLSGTGTGFRFINHTNPVVQTFTIKELFLPDSSMTGPQGSVISGYAFRFLLHPPPGQTTLADITFVDNGFTP